MAEVGSDSLVVAMGETRTRVDLGDPTVALPLDAVAQVTDLLPRR